MMRPGWNSSRLTMGPRHGVRDCMNSAFSQHHVFNGVPSGLVRVPCGSPMDFGRHHCVMRAFLEPVLGISGRLDVPGACLEASWLLYSAVSISHRGLKQFRRLFGSAASVRASFRVVSDPFRKNSARQDIIFPGFVWGGQ